MKNGIGRMDMDFVLLVSNETLYRLKYFQDIYMMEKETAKNVTYEYDTHIFFLPFRPLLSVLLFGARYHFSP